MKPCSTSYYLTKLHGSLRYQARLALSQQDGNLSCTQWERPCDMAQCHDYLGIKMVNVETNPECNLLCELHLPSVCWWHWEWFLLVFNCVLLLAAKESRRKLREVKKEGDLLGKVADRCNWGGGWGKQWRSFLQDLCTTKHQYTHKFIAFNIPLNNIWSALCNI